MWPGVGSSQGASLQPHNQRIDFVPVSELARWNIEPPIFQRFHDPSHQDQLYEKMKPRPLVQPTPIVLGVHNGKHFIGDGQHRLPVFLRLWQENKVDFAVFVTRVVCATLDDLYNLFKLANGSRPFAVPCTRNDMQVAKDVASDFAKRYKKIFKTSAKPKPPHVSINDFTEVLGRLAPHFASAMDLMRAIEELNSQCTKLHHVAFGLRHGAWQSLMKEAREKGGFYLGLFVTPQLWVDIAQGARPAPEKRKKFSAAERKALWDQKFGSDQRQGRCYACGTLIQYELFEMGHRVSLRAGGSNDLANIEPLCGLCNKSCGTEDLDEFKQRLVPGRAPQKSTAASQAAMDKEQKVVAFRRLFVELKPVPLLADGKPDFARGMSAKAMQDAFTHFSGVRPRGCLDLFHKHFGSFTETSGLVLNGCHTCRVYWYRRL